ncbi:histidine kinase [Kitasatospora sp. CMC57]|uniref:histidine kinase n=1 Tax=Kitasatospora sp. CMC57 TaxID=3231513 RepID=A0AB33JQT6_9ACTN
MYRPALLGRPMPQPSPRAVDLLLVAAAVADSWISVHDSAWPDVLLAGLACAALLVRRRWPVAVFVLTMPAALTSYVLLAPLIALFTLAERYRNRPALAACAVLFGVSSAVSLPVESFGDPSAAATSGFFITAPTVLITAGYLIALAAAPVILGQLVQTRRDLAKRLADLQEAQEHQRELHAQTVLARERAQLAREMHDVVSHQVSLIAVHAGALQVTTSDPAAKDAGRTIRTLSVTTLDELRHMVTLLRASGGNSAELAPQPTLAEFAQLIANSGIDVRVEGEPPEDASAPVQRTVYRIIQEALTNIRKHAPGASTVIDIHCSGRGLDITVTNTAPTRIGLALPSSQQGLVGLRERAELLGGTFTSGPTPDGGYTLHVHLPDRTG